MANYYGCKIELVYPEKKSVFRQTIDQSFADKFEGAEIVWSVDNDASGLQVRDVSVNSLLENNGSLGDGPTASVGERTLYFMAQAALEEVHNRKEKRLHTHKSLYD